MTAGATECGSAARRVRAPAQNASNVFALEPTRILRALTQRRRYKYVRPRVVRDGCGWKNDSPNCSRNVDASGAEIDIAWFVRVDEGGWLLHARDHAQACWVLKASGLSLAAALAVVCEDAAREYWQ